MSYFVVCLSSFVFASPTLAVDPYDNLRFLDAFLPLGEFDFFIDGDFLVGGLLTFFGVDPTRARVSQGRAAIHLSIQLQPQLDAATSDSFMPKFEFEFALHYK